MGIYPVSQGTILYNGQDIADWTITERAKAESLTAFSSPRGSKALHSGSF